MTLTLLGLGCGAVDDLTRRAWHTLENAPSVILRTAHHPCVPHLPGVEHYQTCDDLYEAHARFSDVYDAIVARVIAAAGAGDVVYAVPGDPFVGESTTARLIAEATAREIPVAVVHGISFVEPSLRLAGVDAIDGLQIADALVIGALHHPPLNPDYPALIAQVYSRQAASNLKLTLANQYPDEFGVLLIHGAGTDAAHVERLALYEIDRSPHISHLTSLYLPALGGMSSFEQFQAIIAHLRAPEGCPWDREQTHESLRRYLIEEAYEVLDAIDRGDMTALVEELGDLLLQVVLHTQIATEDGDFTMPDVLRRVNRKMIVRHPHVWGDVQADNPSQVVTNWEAIKAREKADKGEPRRSILDGVPPGLPALLGMYKIHVKAAKVGFDWARVEDVAEKVREELDEVLNARTPQERFEEIGDLLSALVNLSRFVGVDDPESALRHAARKFYNRFRYIEERIAERGERPLEAYTLDEMDALWNEAKANGL